MSEFIRSSAELDKAILACNSPEEIREVTKAHLAASGVISRQRGDDYATRLLKPFEEAAPVVPMSVSPAVETCTRVIYPAGNNRFELYGASEGDLDAKEAQIRALFGGQR